MITIVDYGLGNVEAIANIYRRLDIPVARARSAAELAGAQRLILPGVGAFDWAMSRLAESGMREMLDTLVIEQGRPVLGICVGMQMMASRSDEGRLPGLGWIDADVRRFDESRFTQRTHLPHMGWNDIRARDDSGVLSGLAQGARFYFLHSYYFDAHHADQVLAYTDYGAAFASAVQRDNICGVQFHPEKSHQFGIRLLKNFAEL